VQVQGGKNTLLGENPEELTQPSTHDSSSSPSQKHGTLSLPLDDLGIPIAYTKKPRSTDGKLPPNLSQYDISNYVSYVSLGSQYKSFIAALDSTVPITRDWQETKQYPVLRAVMIEEMAALDKNNTWVLTTLPPIKKVVGCKWVYSVKNNSEGNVERYKARLVAKGYNQTYGVDYDDTFAPLAKMNKLRALIFIAANNRWKLFQMDVKNAFLHGDFHEEVYMDIPPGFNSRKSEGKVCTLKNPCMDLNSHLEPGLGGFERKCALWVIIK
jgi:hypothetical protein